MLLESKNLEFQYSANSPIIKDFSLKIENGEFVMISGPNGSGKSTVLKLLSSFLKPDKGEVKLNSKLIQKYTYAERASQIAVVSQNPTPILNFTVFELIMSGRSGSLNRFAPPSQKDCDICNELMELFELTQFQNRIVNQLSGGEKARVFLAKALAQQPQLLLLDEPTSAFDLEYTFKTMEILKQLSRKIGVVMICHDLNLAWQYADRLILLKGGEIFAQGAPKEILTAETINQVYHCQAQILSSAGIVFSQKI